MGPDMRVLPRIVTGAVIVLLVAGAACGSGGKPAPVVLPIVLALGLALTACGGGGGDKKAAQAGNDQTGSSTAPDKVQGSVASYDLAAGPASRFILGIFNEAKGPVGYGTVPFSFFFLG